jgi:hypothetical protein
MVIVNAQLFSSGKTWQEYMNSITRNRDAFEKKYAEFRPSEDDLAPFREHAPLNIVAIAEDWCPDVHNTLGLVARIAKDIRGIQMRIFERDTYIDLMDLYVVDGTKRRIPVFAFFSHDFRQLGWWSGRNKQADEWVSAFRKGRPYDEIPEDEMVVFREEFQRRYDKEYALGNLEEIKSVLRSLRD